MLKKVWSSPEAVPQLLTCSIAILAGEGKAYFYRCSYMQVGVEEILSVCSNQVESDTHFIFGDDSKHFFRSNKRQKY